MWIKKTGIVFTADISRSNNIERHKGISIDVHVNFDVCHFGHNTTEIRPCEISEFRRLYLIFFHI